MATATTSTSNPNPNPAPVETLAEGLQAYRLNVDEFQRMADSGVFGPKSKVILWKGQLAQKVTDVTKDRPHVTAFNLLMGQLFPLAAGEYFLEPEQPLAVGPSSMPEPDLKFVRGRPADFRERAPSASDAPLVIEVADSSVRLDTTEMLRAYAGASVAVYWVVNLLKGRIEVYGGPTGPGPSPTYTEQRFYGPGEAVPVVLDGREVGRVAVDDVLS